MYKKRNVISISTLIVSLICLSVLLYSQTIVLFPAFIHSWTQSDRYALALNFISNGFDLFHPKTFNLQTTEGITRVDFPINEFIVALLMKIFGTTSPFIFRIYTLTISIIGLIFLFLTTKKITNSETKSYFITLFVFLSPVYTYYQIGFIPSIPAISFFFIGFYYFVLYNESNKIRFFILAILFFLLATLIRLPFLIFLLTSIILILFSWLKNKKVNNKELVIFSTSMFIFVGYYLYNVHLGKLYGNMFLSYLMPAKNFDELKEIVAEMYNHWGFHYFTLWHYLILLSCVVYTIVVLLKYKKARGKQKYWSFFLITFCGSSLYFLAMAKQYYAHDYYFLDSFFVPIILLFILLLKNIKIEKLFQKIIWNSIFSIISILFFINSKNIQAERYSTGPWDRTEITRQNFIGTENFLDRNKISKEAKILVIDAYTTNVSLILMNRKGYTVLGTTKKNISTSLFWCKWDYVAIQDNYLVSDVIKSYPLITSLLEKVASTGRVTFYKRSSRMHSKTLKEFLSISVENTLYSQTISFDEPITDTAHVVSGWTFSKKYFSPPQAAMLDSTIEYGTTFRFKASELKSTTNLKALISAKIWNDTNIDKVQLVAAITNAKETVFYQNYFLSDYLKSSSKWQQIEFQFVLPSFKTSNDELKIYLWNPSKPTTLYDDLELIVYK